MLRLFLSYFVAAVQGIFLEFGKEILVMLNAPDLPPMPVVAGSLINELDQADQEFILTLDDYHYPNVNWTF